MPRPKQERRKAKRVAVELWIEAEAKDELYFHRTANLSVGGAFFAQTIPQPVGTIVNLRFALPGDASEIRCEGKVVSAPEGGLGMGVEFEDLAEDDRRRIERLIERADKARS